MFGQNQPIVVQGKEFVCADTLRRSQEDTAKYKLCESSFKRSDHAN